MGKVIRDFFDYSIVELNYYDLIISNPPFSLKKEIITRLCRYKGAYVLAMNLMAFGYHDFIDNLKFCAKPQLILPNKRISFDGNPVAFSTVYLCKNFLQKQDIECMHLDSANVGLNFRPSRMMPG
jgi:hypothetical protein